MRSTLAKVFIAGLVVFGVAIVSRLEATPPGNRSNLDSLDKLDFVNSKPELATYRGRQAVRLLPLTGHLGKDEDVLAVLRGTDFKDGTIEIDVAGKPVEGASPTARGFIGLAFRVQPKYEKYECFYIRPTNGRADDQLRRNHSTQYISSPEWPWYRLRKETPGVYESYADMEPGMWTRLKIVVAGTQAKLYVNGAAQPTLIVNDLKLGEGHGAIALWSTTETDAYYSELKIN